MAGKVLSGLGIVGTLGIFAGVLVGVLVEVFVGVLVALVVYLLSGGWREVGVGWGHTSFEVDVGVDVGAGGLQTSSSAVQLPL
jgi:hypothetical protein